MEEEENSEQVENVKIFVRILPLVTMCESSVKIGDNNKDIYVRCLQDMKRDKSLKSKSPVYWNFQTDRIFFNNSQEEVYEGVTGDLLKNILDGANCVLISYGQTGTGKSFTTAGLRNNFEHRGVIARLLSDMFEEKRKRKYSSEIQYRLSFIEIYQNQVTDLLIGKKERLKCNNRDALKKISSVCVNSEDETLRKVFEGEARKSIEKGATYDASHLGTSILTFHFENTSLITSGAVVAHSKIHIVDMAGVDSVGNSRCRKSAEQVCNANLDKTQLEQFILALQNPKRSNLPRQRSNLIKYLGGELNPSSILRFVAHIRASSEDLVLTLSVLRFGSSVKKLRPERIKYEVVPETTSEIAKLREDVAALKQELDLNQMLLQQEACANMSTERAKQIEQDAIDFINGSLDDLMLLSVSQAQILLKTFKDMFAKLEEDHKIALQQAAQSAYDLAAKDLKGSASSVINKKSSKTTVTGSSSKIKRKKSAVERLSKVTSETSLTDDQTTNKKVGEIYDPGITIGPGLNEPATGPVIALMKFNRYGETPIRLTVPCSDSVEPKTAVTSKVMERDDAFEIYLRDDGEALGFKKELDDAEAARKSGQAVAMELVSKGKVIKAELESTRAELREQQNIRHMAGNEMYDDEGRVLIPELERRLFNTVRSHERDWSNMQCQVIQANYELRQLVDNELTAGYNLELAFQKFCDKMNDQVILPKLENNGPAEVVPLESVDATEKMKSKFVDMQKMMKFMIEKKSSPKEEWRCYIGNAKRC